MDYKKFYLEIADWIMQSNQTAMKYGMDSQDFWWWVMDSLTDIAERYGNNSLVLEQVSMLHKWLNDFYVKGTQANDKRQRHKKEF